MKRKGNNNNFDVLLLGIINTIYMTFNIFYLIKTHFVLVSSIGFQEFDYLTAGFLTALILQLLVTYAASKMERYPLFLF